MSNKSSSSADHPGRRVHGGGGASVAHEALRVRGVLQAAGRAALHHAGGAALLPALLRRLLRGVLRRVRRAHRRGPGPDVPRGPALARHGALLRVPHVPRQPARPPLPAAQGSHLLLHSVLQRRAPHAVRLLRARPEAAASAATAEDALAEVSSAITSEGAFPSYDRCGFRTERLHSHGDASASPAAAARLPQPRPRASGSQVRTIHDGAPDPTDSHLGRNERRSRFELETSASRGSADRRQSRSFHVDAGADSRGR